MRPPMRRRPRHDTAETNNSQTLELASAPDMVAENLNTPSINISAGDVITLNWTDSNYGSLATYAGWWDRIIISNRARGTVFDTRVFYDPTLPGNSPLQPGSSIERTFNLKIPDGFSGAGILDIYVVANDALNFNDNMIEAVVGVQFPRDNNEGQLTISSATRPYADLKPTISAPASGGAGAPVTVSWTVTNIGQADAPVDSWTDQVILSTDSIIGNADDVVIGSFLHTGGLAKSDQYTRTEAVTLPAQLSGIYYSRCGLTQGRRFST